MRQSQVRESRVLDLLAERYRAQGYTFFKYPSKEVLPPFLGVYRPDAIALGPKDNVAIEVQTGDKGNHLLPKLFEGQKTWRFEVVLAREFPAEEEFDKPSFKEVNNLIEEANRLLAAGSNELDPESHRFATSALALAEYLESQGLADEQAGKRLRECAKYRNKLVHGLWDEPLSADLVRFILDLATDVLSEAAI
jgi:hypothetical protein